MSVNYYALLGVHRQSSAADIKAAWRLKARELHPDRLIGGATEVIEAASARFAEASTAYHTLVDARRHAAYVERLTFLGKPCRTCKGAGFRARAHGGFANVKLEACKECQGAGCVDVIDV